MLTTTLRLLREHGACYLREGADPIRLLSVLPAGIGDDDPIPLLTGLGRLSLDDVLWSLRATPPEQAAERDRVARLFTCDCAERSLPLWDAWAATHVAEEPVRCAPRGAVETARRFARGAATTKELAAAWDAAWDAAGDAARVAAWDAAWAAAGDATGDAAWDAAWAAERAWQADRIGQYLRGEVTP